jgi:hypothetical protein
MVGSVGTGNKRIRLQVTIPASARDWAAVLVGRFSPPTGYWLEVTAGEMSSGRRRTVDVSSGVTVLAGHLVARFKEGDTDQGSVPGVVARCDIWYVDRVVPSAAAGDVGPPGSQAAKLIRMTSAAVLANVPEWLQLSLAQKSDTGAGRWLTVDEAAFSDLIERLGTSVDDLPMPVLTFQLATREERVTVWRTVRAAAPVVRERLSRYVERGCVGDMVKGASNYRCQICEALRLPAVGFLKFDGTPFAEAHHVVPVSTLEDDVLGPENVIVVCPNHHRQLHLGGVVTTDEGAFFRFDFPFGHPTVRVKKFVQPK